MDMIPPPGPFTRSDEREDRFAFLRLAGAAVGLILTLVGAWMCVMLFMEIYAALKEPRIFADRLDKWEHTIRGQAVLLDAASEGPPAGFRTPSDPRGRQESVSIARPVAEVMALTARPTAAGLMVIVIVILIRIAIGLIHAGGGLMQLSVSEKELLKRVMAELSSRKKE